MAPSPPEGLEALKAELAELEGEGRRAIAARILAARELGDLKENAEYHIAKEDQAHLETRIQRLQQRLREARVVEAPAGDTDQVAFGGTVTVVDEESGREATYTIVGPTEADAAERQAVGRVAGGPGAAGQAARRGRRVQHAAGRAAAAGRADRVMNDAMLLVPLIVGWLALPAIWFAFFRGKGDS